MSQTQIVKVLSLVGATLGTLGYLYFFLIIEKTEQSLSYAIPSLLIGMAGITYLVYSGFRAPK